MSEAHNSEQKLTSLEQTMFQLNEQLQAITKEVDETVRSEQAVKSLQKDMDEV